MLLNIIYTLWIISTMIVVGVLNVITAAIIRLVTSPFDRNQILVHYNSVLVVYAFRVLSPLLRIKVTGREHIDRNQRYVIVCNHQSMLDIMILYLIPLRFKWVSKREVYRIPLAGQLLWLHNDIVVRRGNSESVKKMMSKCSHFIRNGMNIIIFPEGTRSRTGKVGRFKDGAFTMAKTNNTAILPVVAGGIQSFHKGNGRFLFNARQRIDIKILPPVSPAEVSATDIHTLTEKIHLQMLDAHRLLVPKDYSE